MKRDWSDAIQKVEIEGKCRVCGRTMGLQAAHVSGRRYDIAFGSRSGDPHVLYVHPDDVVPLCSRTENGRGGCHAAYDSRDLDLLPYLTLAEQARAAGHVGLVRALARTTGRRV